MPTYPVSPQITVDALLKQPETISRNLVNLVSKHLVADRLFVRGSSSQVIGGAIRYQRDESIYTDNDPEVIAARGGWPRTGWSEDLETGNVTQYGFEVVINGLAIRRHSMDQMARAQRKLANTLVKYIDTKAMTVLTTDADVQTLNGDTWSTSSTDIIGNIATAQEKIEVLDKGYAGFDGATLVLNPKQRKNLFKNTGLLAALPREAQDQQIRTGMLAPILGLKEILFTPQLAETTAILMDTSVAGTIADEQPDPAEGFAAYDPGPGFAPVYVKTYEEAQGKDWVIAAGRWPAIVLPDPGAVVVIDIS